MPRNKKICIKLYISLIQMHNNTKTLIRNCTLKTPIEKIEEC